MQTTRSHARHWPNILGLVVTLLLVSCTNHAGINDPAPAVNFKTLSSAKPIALSELGKPLLVNFWSTSCVICINEMPELSAMYEEFKPKGFEMVAVAMPFDMPSDVVEISEAQKLPYLVALDFSGEISESFGEIQFTPTSFLIDKDGVLIEKYVGRIDLDAFKKKLNSLMEKG